MKIQDEKKPLRQTYVRYVINIEDCPSLIYLPESEDEQISKKK